MLVLKKKFNILDSCLLKGFKDIHTHILYGVDDGVSDKGTALDTLLRLEELGITNICLTPHIMNDLTDNNPDFLNQRYEELKNEYRGNISLSLGAEYMLDNNFGSHLNNKILTIGDNYILVETSYLNPPLNFDSILNEVRKKGYYIILAHPERYLYMDKDNYEKLEKEDFLYFQLNILSLTGYYGKKAQESSKFLLKNDFYKFIGSDIHNLDRHMTGYGRKALTGKQINKLEVLKENNNMIFN